MASARPTKRLKNGTPEVIIEAWEHYRNFVDAESISVDNEENEDQSGAIDELMELIELLEQLDFQPFSMKASADDFNNINIQTLIPILISMSNLHLATYATSYALNDADETSEFVLDSPKQYFEQALEYWPSNPAALSLYANYDRMNCGCLKTVCERYVKASEFAKTWRQVAVDYLENAADVKADIDGLHIKEWVELLIVNGALGVDCIDETDEEDANNSKEEETGEYSFSEIEATAAFMSALLLSTLGKHEEALHNLKKFDLTHRIHPNVWKVAHSSITEPPAREKSEKGSTVMFQPTLYLADGTNSNGSQEYIPKGVLPSHLYQRMCTLFAPKAAYWTESDYNNRGYYSYFIDLDDCSNGKSVREKPTNIIEDVIVNHLLPLVQMIAEIRNRKIVGAEWWCHTRQLGANLGHQIHFDTDESLLGREKKVTHPIVSSVLYLTGAKHGTAETAKAGATIVCNQTPDSKEVASKAWVSHPNDNSFMTFPGNLLHGVLPCLGPEKPKAASEYEKSENNRLTFMVGFWTRNVAEGMADDRELYGPCGPLPPSTDEHSWVTECQKGYKESDRESIITKNESRLDITGRALPCTSPAWEQFKSQSSSEVDSTTPILEVPRGLDHRYFVLNAPHCFTESLYENEDCF